ncbi:hypothetical protein [Thaumasiovibrio sp. DFM-14]|uniref:hypothetical protein n=1 Tax=Thaumasiovibrio sp. DFM-14 TaxID=3384792 RepID=UPI0039A0FB5B
MELQQLEQTTNEIDLAVKAASSSLILKPAVPVLRLVVTWMKGVNNKVGQLEQQMKKVQL